jgi:hypothetical protein
VAKVGTVNGSKDSISNLDKEIGTVATKKVSENNNSKETTNVENTWTDPKDYGPVDGGNNILAAWQGLYWLFNARVDRFDATPEGVYAVGFRVDSQYDPDKIVHDISTKGDKRVERRLDLIPAIDYVRDSETVPPLFADSNAMTQFMAQYARGSGDSDGRSPDYFKGAIADYKKQHGLAIKRGRPPKTIKIEALTSIDESLLANIDIEELEKFKATIERSLASRSA